MSASKPNPPPPQAFNDVLARMMQAEVNEGGPPPATPCDTPAEVISQIHITDPMTSDRKPEDAVQTTKKDFQQMLTDNLDRLRDEIHAAQTKGETLTEAAKAQWSRTIADLDAKQRVARDKLSEVASSTGEAWEHLREGAKNAWKDLEQAVRKARSEF
jgi:hypothetical protein